jgi:hypothetical protein
MREVIRYFMDLLRLGSFVVFVVLGFSVLRKSDVAQRRRAINLLLIYVLAVNLVIGVSQRDAWPFSPYPLMRGVWNGTWIYQKLAPVALDAAGREWEVDPRSWAPVFPFVLQEWFNVIFPELSAPRKRQALEFLFDRAERTRNRLAQGRRVGNERILGSLTAPDWWLYRRVDAVSPAPYVAIRFYREWWRPYERLRDNSKFHRDLIGEYRLGN